jgi:hypothetical protein
MRCRLRLFWAILAILSGCAAAFAAGGLSAQTQVESGQTQWGEPMVLFDATSSVGAADPRVLFYPFVVVDAQERLRVFWEVGVDKGGGSPELSNGIYCTEGDGTHWSTPVDVIVAPDGGRTYWPQHAVDSRGMLHLVWVGPNATLFYSRAPIAKACDARSWETVVLPISDQVLNGDIAVDDQDILHVAYASRGGDVYYLRSPDDGHSWSEPVAVSLVPSTAATAFPSIAIDATGRVHIAWEEDLLPDGVPGLGLFYAVSADHGQSWTDPLQIADGAYTHPNVGALPDGTTHLFWDGRAGTQGRYHQWSGDGGRTWTNPVEFIPKSAGGGGTGRPRYVVDSTGRLHLVSGTDAVTYIAWDGHQWLNPPVNIAGYLEFPNIAISRGRVLHVVASDMQRIMYIQGTVDAPERMPEIITPPTRVMEATQSVGKPETQATMLPPTTPTAVVLSSGVEVPPKAENPFLPALVGGGAAFLLVAAVVAVNLSRRRR